MEHNDERRALYERCRNVGLSDECAWIRTEPFKNREPIARGGGYLNVEPAEVCKPGDRVMKAADGVSPA